MQLESDFLKPLGLNLDLVGSLKECELCILTKIDHFVEFPDPLALLFGVVSGLDVKDAFKRKEIDEFFLNVDKNISALSRNIDFIRSENPAEFIKSFFGF